MSRRFLFAVFSLLVILSACSSSTGPSVIGEAFVGPPNLNLREEISLRSRTVATVHHGDKVDIVQTRRRFVQVRSPQGAIGWTDSRQLLTSGQMGDLRRLSESTRGLPSQGMATVYEKLNVHTEPVRTSTTFTQIPERTAVQVIGHKVMPRRATVPDRPIIPLRKSAKAGKKPREAKPSWRVPPPPMPAPPGVPPNWEELSRSPLLSEEPPAEEPSEPEKPPVPMDDWSLVRTKDNRAGWVLSRMLVMAIPDEVAQYAEGHRITSFFALDDVQDQGQTKHAWLWTTNSHSGEPFEFDGYRVFIWNTRRHRYETVFRGRDVKGFYPVEATRVPGGAVFSIVIDQQGQLVRKVYSFKDNHVTLSRSEPYTGDNTMPEASQSQAVQHPQQRTATPWYRRLAQRFRSLFR